jgi:phenylacetate-CoA ligase
VVDHSDAADILYLPADKLQDIQDRHLAEMVEVCYEGHPFYRKLMRAEGLEPRHIRTCRDLQRLPVTTKTDFLADPEAFRLQHKGLPEEAQTLWNVVYTTGTTSGRPAPVYITSFDHYAYMYASRRRMGFIGLRDTDTVANLFPLTPFPMGAYARAVDEMAACGIAIVYGQTGRPTKPFDVHRSLDEAVALVERHRVTVLWGVASFVRRVLVRAKQLGADFSAVRMAMITGEASSPAMRDDMSRRMSDLGCAGADVVNRYGSTEQGSSMVECQPGSGFHNLAPDQLFHEVVDVDSGRRLDDGERGMLAFTHLMRRGTAFLRYAVGDVVAMQTDTCPHCGRTSPRISSDPVRTGDVLKIKGTLVNLHALKEALEGLGSVEEYQIVIQASDANDDLAMDELVIRLAVPKGAENAALATVTEETLRIAQIRPRVEFAARDEIFDPTSSAKPRRIDDRRATA